MIPFTFSPKLQTALPIWQWPEVSVLLANSEWQSYLKFAHKNINLLPKMFWKQEMRSEYVCNLFNVIAIYMHILYSSQLLFPWSTRALALTSYQPPSLNCNNERVHGFLLNINHRLLNYRRLLTSECRCHRPPSYLPFWESETTFGNSKTTKQKGKLLLADMKCQINQSDQRFRHESQGTSPV